MLAVVADIFQQQNYFQDETKTKQYEHDESESFKTDSDSLENPNDENSMNPGHTASESDMRSEANQSSVGKSASIMSNADSIRQGGVEDNLMGLSSKAYMPKSYKHLRILAICLIWISLISTTIVLVYDYIFKNKLSESVNQQHLIYSLDSAILRSIIGLQLVYISNRRSFEYDTIYEYFIRVYGDDISSIDTMILAINFDRHQIGKDIAMRMIDRPTLAVRYQNYPNTNDIAYVELYEVYSNMMRLFVSRQDLNMSAAISDNSFSYFTFKNINQVMIGISAHLEWTWASYLSDHRMSLILILVAFLVMSAGVSGWLLLQISKCYDYINQVYGLMVGFSPSVLRSHTSLINELSQIMENKIDDKKIRKRAKRSLQKSEDGRRHDLGLKTAVKSLHEIPKPKAIMLTGMQSLILLVCGFNTLVLFSMKIFDNDSLDVLKLDEYLHQAHVTIYASSIAKISRALIY